MMPTSQVRPVAERGATARRSRHATRPRSRLVPTLVIVGLLSALMSASLGSAASLGINSGAAPFGATFTCPAPGPGPTTVVCT